MKQYFAHISAFILLSFHLLQAWGQGVAIDNLNQEAYKLYRENVKAAKSLALLAQRMAQNQGLKPQAVDSYINLSRCYRIESNWDSAYWVLDQAVILSKEIDYELGLMNATNNRGFCLMLNREYPEAKKMFQESLVYAKKLKNSKGKANAYNNIFIIATNEQENDSAYYYIKKALSSYQEAGDSIGIARAFLNQADWFYRQNQNDSAIFLQF